jgi:hypothetical protein
MVLHSLGQENLDEKQKRKKSFKKLLSLLPPPFFPTPVFSLCLA